MERVNQMKENVGFGLMVATFFELKDDAKIMDEMSSHALEMKFEHR